MRGTDTQIKATFHFILEFPATYPLSPPHIKLCTPIPHPNVLPDKYVTYLQVKLFNLTNKNRGFYSLCMDMLEEGEWSEDIDKNMKYSGWSSAYTVQLILVQLQVFAPSPLLFIIYLQII